MFKKLMVLLTVVMMLLVGVLPASAATEVADIVVLAENYTGWGKDTITVTNRVPSLSYSEWTPSKATGGDAGVVIPFNKWQWLSYDVVAHVAGTYKITASAGVPTGLGGLVIYGEDKNIGSLCETYCDPSGGWTTYADYEVGTVNLKEGSNYIKVMNTTSGMYFDKLTFTKVDDEPYSMKINTEYYTDSYNASAAKAGVYVDYLSGKNEYTLSYQLNDWVEYEINAPEAGTYNLAANAGSAGAKVEVTINDESPFEGTVTSTGGLLNFGLSDLGDVDLNEGKNTIKVKNISSGFYLEGLILTKTETVDNPEVENTDIVVLAENYNGSGKDSLTVTSGVASLSYSEWSPSKATGGDAGVVIPFNKWQWLSYDVVALAAGTYKITASAGVPTGLGGLVIYGEDKNISSLCETYCEPSGGWTTYADYEVGTVNLKEGSNYIKVMNTTSGMYFDKLTFTKVDDEPYSMKINAEYYTDSYKASTAKAGVSVESLAGNKGYTLSYQANDWVEYEINVPEKGVYELSAHAGSVGAKVEVTINDATTFHGNITSSGALTTFNVSDLGGVILNEGKNTIKVKNISSGFYFEGLTLTKVETAKELDLEDYYDISEGASVLNGQASIPADEWVSYKFNTEYCGAYEFELDGKFDVFVGDEKVASTENGIALVPITMDETVIKFVAKEAATLSEIKADVVSLSVKFEAEGFESSYCNSKDAPFTTNATTTAISFNSKDWLAFTINAPQSGSYLFTTYGASVGGAKINILNGLENDDLVIGNGTTNNDGADWSCPPSYSNLCKVNLSKGANVIRIYNAGGGYSFDSFMVTYAGEAKAADGFELSVENAIDRYDSSADKTLPVSTATGNVKYVSFGLNDYLTFEVFAPVSAVYTVDAYGALPSGSPAIAVANKGVGIVSGAVEHTAEYYDFTARRIGDIAIKAGKNEIEIMSIGSQFHFSKLVLTLKSQGEVEKSFEIDAEDYMFGGEDIGYHDNTYDIDNEDIHIYRGDDVEVLAANGGLAVDMEAEEWLCYTIEAPSEGYYNVQALACANVAATYAFGTSKVKLYVNDEEVEAADVATLINGVYVPVNISDVYLEEGENTFKFELVSGAICIDKIAFSTSDIELTKDSGIISAKGNLNGLFSGKDVLCVLAVYDADNRLIDVKVDDFVGGICDVIDLSSSADGNAKLFIWNNQKGNVNILD